MLKHLKQQVYKANQDLKKQGLVLLSWGNASGIDRKKGLVVIKPSGLAYDKMTPEDMVVVDLDGKVVEGKLKPSSDTATHLVLYKSFTEIGGIVHTHSTYATAWAQAGKSIPLIGTTHADNFSGDIPCSEDLLSQQIEGDYEKETGNSIIETFKNNNYEHIPGVIVKNHGPFTWGKDVETAVLNSVVLEELAKMAFFTFTINPKAGINKDLAKKHFERKHGKDAYYGQNE
ncbi:MAG: L-ribulose-5-phosphate 4-epimerase [Bacteroidales bacterium]|nr:L-ribulose-5-phosphate 4-epimerase [Bacteroidales bacterium]MCF8389849.1 L-ribulose-5-phosphate 4-epimerase [Bacteroidales bacterium]